MVHRVDEDHRRRHRMSDDPRRDGWAKMRGALKMAAVADRFVTRIEAGEIPATEDAWRIAYGAAEIVAAKILLAAECGREAKDEVAD